VLWELLFPAPDNFVGEEHPPNNTVAINTIAKLLTVFFILFSFI